MKYFQYIVSICEENEVSQFDIEFSTQFSKTDLIYEKLIYGGGIPQWARNDLYLDLGLGLNAIKSRIRKS